ncbi:MAG: type III pantothenate kinase, partial [Candidatus Ventricola sp.]
MIFVMDIGNTNIKAAVFEGKKLLKRWRCATDTSMTSDQYGIIMSDLFRYHELNIRDIEGIMI